MVVSAMSLHAKTFCGTSILGYSKVEIKFGDYKLISQFGPNLPIVPTPVYTYKFLGPNLPYTAFLASKP